MNETEFGFWIKIWSGVAAGMSFVLLLWLGTYRPERKILRAYGELRGYLAVKSRESLWCQRKAEWLAQKGAAFHFGTHTQPLTWLAMQTASAMAGFAAGLGISLWCAIPASAIAWFLPDWLAQFLNHRDNEKMLPEIKLIYHALEIQIRAGVYVTDALAECYAGVQDRRLKQALLNLAGDITMKADIRDALEHFQGRFDNRYIDALCITILQALESGQAVELLGDIAEQVKDMEIAVLGRRRGALERSVTFYQLGILAALLGVVLYACITQLFSAALSF